MSRPNSERRARVTAAAHSTGDLVYRSRFGLLGTEPPAGRNPVLRYGSLVAGLAAVLVCVGGGTEAAAALAAISLALGAPRSSTLRHDIPSAAAWAVSVAMLVVAEIVYAAGGSAARAAFGSHRSAGTAAVLVSLAAIIALLSYVRRWGTGGNSGLIARGLRRGDPRTIAAVQRSAEREGHTPRHRDDD